MDVFQATYCDGHGHAWSVKADGSVYTRYGSLFWGGYPNLRDANGHEFPARVDFGDITARLDGKPGYTLWPLTYRKGERYDFGPDLVEAHTNL